MPIKSFSCHVDDSSGLKIQSVPFTAHKVPLLPHEELSDSCVSCIVISLNDVTTTETMCIYILAYLQTAHLMLDNILVRKHYDPDFQ
jgi:hypothetical protein